MLDVDQTYEESLSMAGPLGAVAFVTLKALEVGGLPLDRLNQMRLDAMEFFAELSTEDCNVLAEVAHRRLAHRPLSGVWYE